VQAWGSSLASLGRNILNGSNGTFSRTQRTKGRARVEPATTHRLGLALFRVGTNVTA
jgi:hypothetical protein